MEKTIAAISTAPAPGGIGIVRISGAEAFAVADRVFRGVSGKKVSGMGGYTAQLGAAYDAQGEKLDDVVALVFRGPKSYTGEDVVELSCHGGLYVTRRLLQAVLDQGAAPAGPGEFTRRAFLNGKMDLTQAEAVMELIGAGGEQAAREAQAGSSGALAQRVGAVYGMERVLYGSMWVAGHMEDGAAFCETDTGLIRFKKYYQRIYKGTGNEYLEWIEMIKNSYEYYCSQLDRQIEDQILQQRKKTLSAKAQVPIISAPAYPEHTLYIFGHSLDVTDRDVLRMLICNDNVKTVIFYHRRNKNDKTQLEKLIKNLILLIGQDELIRRTGGERRTIEFVPQELHEN